MEPWERWPTARAPGWWGRGAFLAVAAAGHALFLAILAGSDRDAVMVVSFAAPNLVTLAWIARRRVRSPHSGWAVVGLGFSLAALTGVVVGATRVGRDLSGALVGVFAGVFGEILGVAVLAPLALTLDRWRHAPSPRRALDAWAALAFCALAFSLVEPDTSRVGSVHYSLHEHGLRVMGVAFAAALALSVFVAEVSTIVRVDRARAGRVAGLRVSESSPESWGDVSAAPSWEMTNVDRLVPLVRVDGEGSYREAATPTVVAMIPATSVWSWRVFVLPVLAAIALYQLLA